MVSEVFLKLSFKTMVRCSPEKTPNLRPSSNGYGPCLLNRFFAGSNPAGRAINKHKFRRSNTYIGANQRLFE